jgi:hypothetical protein
LYSFELALPFFNGGKPPRVGAENAMISHSGSVAVVMSAIAALASRAKMHELAIMERSTFSRLSGERSAFELQKE